MPGPGELRRVAASLAVLVALLGWLTCYTASCDRKRAEANEKVGAEKKGESHALEAAAHQAEAEKAEAVRKQLDADARAKKALAERDALIRQLAAKPTHEAVPAVPGEPVGPGEVPDLRDLLIEKQQEVIKDQGEQIQARDAQIALDNKIISDYKASLAAQRDATRSAELALEGQKAANRGAYLKGVFHGALGGLTIGLGVRR